MSLVVSAFAIEKGPGPQVGSSESSSRVTILSTATAALCTQGLSSFRRHTTVRSRPPGTSDWRTFLIAATGLAKNIVPHRANA
jgi:hypothetical protein